MNSVKTLVYMGVMHGLFTFYIPWRLASVDPWAVDTGLFQYLAFPLWATGIWVILHASIDIVRQGRGTPAHLDPPQSLIVSGFYRRVRNPIYLAALLIQLGTLVWFGSKLLILYLLCFLLAFHVLIVFIEEPILQNKFGVPYEEYRRQVPRWLPRFYK